MLSKLFIFLAVILIPIVILFSCDKNPINESNNDYKFWSAPEEDALILYFRFSDELEVDSLFAGQIQFRLDCARTVDKKLESIFAMRSWELGVLLLGVSDDLYSNFNPETYRFNYQPLDSLLDFYNVIGGKKSSGFSGTYGVKLEFSIKYNMPVLAKAFEDIDGIWCSCANHCGILPEGPPYDIWLAIEGDLYKFTFNIKDWPNNKIHYWEIHVINDQVDLIAQWEKKIY